MTIGWLALFALLLMALGYVPDPPSAARVVKTPRDRCIFFVLTWVGLTASFVVIVWFVEVVVLFVP